MVENDINFSKIKNKIEINKEALKNNLLDYENIGDFFENSDNTE